MVFGEFSSHLHGSSDHGVRFKRSMNTSARERTPSSTAAVTSRRYSSRTPLGEQRCARSPPALEAIQHPRAPDGIGRHTVDANAMKGGRIGFGVSNVAVHVDEHLAEMMRGDFALCELLQRETAEIPHRAFEYAAVIVESVLMKDGLQQRSIAPILRATIQGQHISNCMRRDEMMQRLFGRSTALQCLKGKRVSEVHRYTTEPIAGNTTRLITLESMRAAGHGAGADSGTRQRLALPNIIRSATS